MILGAGRGTRLGALGMQVPKILVDIRGEPLLARQLSYLARDGVQRVVVNVHHLAEQVRAFAAQYHGPPELLLSEEPQLLGTAGGVRHALALLQAETIVVVYGDVLLDTDLRALLAAHRASGAAATISVYASEATKDKGTIEIDGSGRVLAFREKSEEAEGVHLINAGLYVVEREFIAEAVAPGEVSDFGHDVFPTASRAGTHLGVFLMSESVLDIGTPEALQQARQ